MRALLAATALALLIAPALRPRCARAASVSRELIVVFAPGARATPATPLAQRFAGLGLEPVACLGDRLPPAAAPGAAAKTTFAIPRAFDLDPARAWLFRARDSLAAERALHTLARDPAVAWAERNAPRAPQVWSYAFAPPPAGTVPADSLFPNDPLFRGGRQWGLENRGELGPYHGARGADVRAPAAWRASVGGNDVLLAIADTGIDPDHPELAATLPGGVPRITGARDMVADSSARDLYGHGTPVAGVAAARTNDGAHLDSLGIAGVCGGDGGANFGCRIVPIKITPGNAGDATSFHMAAAVLYAARLGARAVNLSFAGDLPSRLERLALFHAITHGCVPVVSSGNRGFSDGGRPQYPAAYAALGLCIQVGASDAWDRRAAFSSFGPGLDLLAPGVDVWTTFMTYPSAQGGVHRGYVAASGTSFAAPFVLGAVGLVAAVRPELIDVDFQHLLRESARDLGAPGPDPETGWGCLDLAAALRAVDPAIGVWHDEAAADVFETLDADTLAVAEAGFGALATGRFLARRVRASTLIAIPDSFLAPVRVWPRVGGTTTLGGAFRLPFFMPWAEVADATDDRFTLRGYLYRIGDEPVPLPEDQARFGFTVLGRIDRPPVLEVLAPAPGAAVDARDSLRVAWSAWDPDCVTAVEVWLDRPGGASQRLERVEAPVESGVAPAGPPPAAAWRGAAALALPCVTGVCSLRVVALDEHGRHRDRAERAIAVTVRDAPCRAAVLRQALAAVPNPFARATRITAVRPTRVELFDLTGRRVRHAPLGGKFGAFEWDGTDDRGRALRPGVYLARIGPDAGTAPFKLLKLE